MHRIPPLVPQPRWKTTCFAWERESYVTRLETFIHREIRVNRYILRISLTRFERGDLIYCWTWERLLLFARRSTTNGIDGKLRIVQYDEYSFIGLGSMDIDGHEENFVFGILISWEDIALTLWKIKKENGGGTRFFFEKLSKLSL